jgi:hypothetical protein
MVVFGVVVASGLGCGLGPGLPSAPRAPATPAAPVTPVTPDNRVLERVEVTTITTGIRLDPDGYGVLNDEWDYDFGDGVTVAAPTNGTVILQLRSGDHILSLVGVAPNCSGEDLDDHPIHVPSGAVTRVEFHVVCKES